MVLVNHLLERPVICQHRENGVALARVPRRQGGLRPFRRQRVGLRTGPIIDGDIVSGLEQVGRHAGAHMPQPNKTDVHEASQLRWCLLRVAFGPFFGRYNAERRHAALPVTIKLPNRQLGLTVCSRAGKRNPLRSLR